MFIYIFVATHENIAMLKIVCIEPIETLQKYG